MTHPPDTLLAAHAGGTLPPGLALLLAGHLALCPGCRCRAARLATIGGAFLARDRPEGVAPPALAPALARLPAAGEAPCARAGDDPVLPAPIRRALGRPIGAVRWRPLLPGLAHARLAGFPGEDVRLVRARPGTRIPAHTHAGEEATLVLAGAMADGPSRFGRGAVSLCGPKDDHQPAIVGDEDCICLVVLTGPMRFTGPAGRLPNLLPQ